MFGPGTDLHTLGQGKCPNCRPQGQNATRRAPDLEPGGDSSLVCPVCGTTYPVGGGVP